MSHQHGFRSAPRYVQNKQQRRGMQRIGALGGLLLWIWVSSAKVEAFSTVSLPSSHRAALQAHHYSFRAAPRRSQVLTTKGTGDDEIRQGPFHKAAAKFRARPGTYLLIPCIAAAVGWFTNYLAVQMIFYPIQFRGLPLFVRKEVPLGFIGWQGIVPCKTRPMSEAMVDMVTSQLLSVKEVFNRLNPRHMATLLAPEVPKIADEIIREVVPVKFLQDIPAMVYHGLGHDSKAILGLWNVNFLTGLCKSMQRNVESIFNIRNCVVSHMMQDRRLLGQLFHACGKAELDFLTNSGLWFGFILGIIQMAVALFWENPWSLSIGGGIVGLATNWLALKWIFEPVNPTKVGPFVLQGQFLRRQKEVAKEFSNFFANRILKSEQVWKSILTDPSTAPEFARMFGQHFERFLTKVTDGLRITMEPEVVALATAKALAKLPEHIGVLHEYIDSTLGLEKSLRISMEKMTSAQFERVLHPIFEEDELTLILAGAVLGFMAGLIQQGLETGQIKFPDRHALWQAVTFIPRRTTRFVKAVTKRVGKRKRKQNPSDEETV